MQLNKNKGVALMASLVLMAVTSMVLLLLFNGTLREMRHSVDNAGVTRSMVLARSVGSLSDSFFRAQVRPKLEKIVNDNANTVNRWAFGEGGVNDTEPSPDTVAQALIPVASQLQLELDSLLCSSDVTPIGTNNTVRLRIYVTASACSTPLNSKLRLTTGSFIRSQTNTYALPYIAIAEASTGEYTRNVVLQGEYRFTLKGDKFSKFAMFSGSSQTPDGDPVWFTDDTVIEGPIHTNEFFRFYKKPWFGGQVTSAGYGNPTSKSNSANKRGGEFGTRGFVDAGSLSANPKFVHPNDPSIVDEPEFAGGVDWSASYLELPTTAFDQKTIAQTSGLALPGNLHSLELFAGNNAGSALSADGRGGWSPKATHQYVNACATAASCRSFRYNDSGNLQELQSGNWVTINANFNGVLHVDGQIDRLTGPKRTSSFDIDSAPPAIAEFSQLTVVAEDQVRITGDIKYESPPCSSAPTREANGSVTPSNCNNLGTKNVFGLFTPKNDILLGSNVSDPTLDAPKDLALHGSYMAGEGVVTAENFKFGGSKGRVRVLGGIIQKEYGGFGTFDPVSGQLLSGYGREFSYDQRLGLGLAPPFFPGTTNIEVESIVVLKYGQQEQVY